MSISYVIVVVDKNTQYVLETRHDEEYSEKNPHQNPSTNTKSVPRVKRKSYVTNTSYDAITIDLL